MRIESFDSMEAAWEEMDRRSREGLERATEEQKAISYGDHWMRLIAFSRDEILPIFGYVHTLDEIYNKERELGADEHEAGEVMRNTAHSHERGYRYGTAYSAITPEGELGDTHCVNMWPISKQEFEIAKELSWDLERLLRETNWFVPKGREFIHNQQLDDA